LLLFIPVWNSAAQGVDVMQRLEGFKLSRTGTRPASELALSSMTSWFSPQSFGFRDYEKAGARVSTGNPPLQRPAQQCREPQEPMRETILYNT
jgi:hypothetical protein